MRALSASLAGPRPCFSAIALVSAAMVAWAWFNMETDFERASNSCAFASNAARRLAMSGLGAASLRPRSSAARRS